MRPDRLALVLLVATIIVLIFGDFATRVVFAVLLAPGGAVAYWKVLELGGRRVLISLRHQIVNAPQEAAAHTPLTPNTFPGQTEVHQ